MTTRCILWNSLMMSSNHSGEMNAKPFRFFCQMALLMQNFSPKHIATEGDYVF